MLSTHDDFDPWMHEANAWEGIYPSINVGDTVGLLLDLGQRTLSAYLNGSRRGVIVAPGIIQEHCIFPFSEWSNSGLVGELCGPLHWVADVGGGGSVRIECKPPPPTPTAAELAAEETAFATYQELSIAPQPAPEWVYFWNRNGEPSRVPGD